MAAAADDSDLRVSRIFALMITALTRRPVTAIALAAFTVVLPSLIHARFGPSPPSEGLLTVEFATYAVVSVVMLLPSALFVGWMTLQLVGDVELPLVEAARRFVPLCITMLVVIVVLLLGMLALIIPGILWAVATHVAVPAAAVEKRGAAHAIARSLDLTENRRWAILFASVVLIGLPMIAVALFELVMNDWQIFPEQEHPFITGVSRPIANTLQGIWGTAMGAALYVELLRLWRLKRVESTVAS